MIKLENVKVNFSDNEIVFNDIVFKDGESYVILGPSGCGKTTLLNVVDGNLIPSTGVVTLEDGLTTSNRGMLSYRRNNIGYVSQDAMLFNSLTVKDNLDVMLKISGKSHLKKNKRVLYDEVLSQVGLGGKLNRVVKTLSGGERQRVAIARALLQEPSIMLCDEPTGALNHTLAESIINVLLGVHKKLGNTLIVVTHDTSIVKYFDNVIQVEDLLRNVSSDSKEVLA